MNDPISKARVLMVLIRFFEAGGRARIEDLASKYGVSTRTVQRWLFDIDMEFLHLTSEDGLWSKADGADHGEMEGVRWQMTHFPKHSKSSKRYFEGLVAASQSGPVKVEFDQMTVSRWRSFYDSVRYEARIKGVKVSIQRLSANELTVEQRDARPRAS